MSEQSADDLRAEVERLQRIINGYDRTPAEQRAADAEAERDAARADLAALRDGLREVIEGRIAPHPDFERGGIEDDLRALLGNQP